MNDNFASGFDPTGFPHLVAIQGKDTSFENGFAAQHFYRGRFGYGRCFHARSLGVLGGNSTSFRKMADRACSFARPVAGFEDITTKNGAPCQLTTTLLPRAAACIKNRRKGLGCSGEGPVHILAGTKIWPSAQ